MDGLVRKTSPIVGADSARAAPGRLRRSSILGERFDQPEFRGCICINATSESGGIHSRIVGLASGQVRKLGAMHRESAEESGLEQPAAVAAHLTLLLERAIVVAMLDDPREWAWKGQASTRVLVASATATRSR